MATNVPEGAGVDESGLSGGCLCGRIRYHSDAAPAIVAICHCRNCQRQAGSAFSVLAGVPKGSLTITGEGLKTYEDRGDDSGLPVLRKFCGNCGSPVVSDVASFPDMHFIKAGTLDDPSTLEPQMQLWCDSAWPSLHLPEPQRLPRNPPAG